jgi:hypothetical protein
MSRRGRALRRRYGRAFKELPGPKPARQGVRGKRTKSLFHVGAAVRAAINLHRTGVPVSAGEPGIIQQAIGDRYFVRWARGASGWASQDVLEAA